MISDKALRGAIFVIISGILWGFSGACAQLLYDDFGLSPSWVTSWRLIAGAVLFMILALCFKHKELNVMIRDKNTMIRMVLYGLFGVLGCQLGYMYLISYTNAGIATTIEQVGMIVVIGVTCLKQKRFPRLGEYLSFILAIVGCWCIATNGVWGGLVLSNEAILWSVFAALAMAAYVLMPVELVKKYSTLSVNAVSMVIASVFACLILQPWNYPVELSWPIVGAMAGIVLCGTLGAYMFFVKGVKETGPVRAGLLNTVELVASLVITHFWLGTQFTPFDLLGVALICAMIVVIALTKEKKQD
ncbi:MAG: EamA family transporter [Eggerthellaceae bacterium]|nr:EamA family transporter [Eggerthellaceae bacterium]